MSKEVMLMTDVKGLGTEGDVVEVAAGYARNYLLPKNLAAPVTEATRKRIAKQREAREALLAEQKKDALKLAKLIAAKSCTVSAKTGPEGKLFGSVTTSDVAEALAKEGVKLDRHQIELPGSIRETGVFKITIKLHPEVETELPVWVVEE